MGAKDHTSMVSFFGARRKRKPTSLPRRASRASPRRGRFFIWPRPKKKPTSLLARHGEAILAPAAGRSGDSEITDFIRKPLENKAFGPQKGSCWPPELRPAEAAGREKRTDLAPGPAGQVKKRTYLAQAQQPARKENLSRSSASQPSLAEARHVLFP